MTGPARPRFEDVDRIVDAALDLEPPERDGFVARRCGDDAGLRREVLSLLAACDRSAGYLESPALELGAPLLHDPAPRPDAAPARAGPFRIVAELGHGGMGVVYLAEREDGAFHQRVALKFIREARSSEVVIRRFLEERRILALLEHPGIARLIDGGVTEDGLPYFAMELVEGVPIDQYCDRHQHAIEQRLELFGAVLEAVQYAHEHLVIHRDLKPSNVLVRADGQVRLLDFGIAKLIDPMRESDAAERTRTDLIALTPDYAAPEQIRGRSVSTATDTYALGVLLYLLLTGRRPYEVRGVSPAELERIVCEVDPPRPSDLVTGAARRRLRGDLDLIVLKALHKEPGRRYSSAAALHDDLQRFRAGLPVLARPDRASYRLGKFVRRHRTGVAAAGLVTAALVSATVFSAAQMREARSQRDLALAEVKREQAMSDIQNVLASDTRGPDGRLLATGERIGLAERLLRSPRFLAQPMLASEMLTSLSSRLYEIGDREGQRRLLARAESLAVAAGAPHLRASALCLRALSFDFDDQLDSAHAALSVADATLADARGSGRGAPDLVAAQASCLTARGGVLTDEGHADSALPLLTRAVAMARTGAPLDYLETLNALATALRGVGRTRDATVYQRQVLMGLDSAGYWNTDVQSNQLTFLAGALFELGEVAAVDSVIRALWEHATVLDPAHPSGVPVILYGLAKLRAGELDSADLWLTRAARNRGSDAGAFDSYLPAALTQLRLEQGRLREARQHLATLPGGTFIRRVNRAWLTARILYGEGNQRGGEAMLEDSLHALAGEAPKPPPPLAMPLVTAAEWRLARNDPRGADSLAVLARAAAAVDSLAFSRSGYVGRAEAVHARAQLALGRSAAARDGAERAVIALSNGFGRDNPHTRRAVALRDSLR